MVSLTSIASARTAKKAAKARIGTPRPGKSPEAQGRFADLGFTLLELLVVIAVISLVSLAVIVGPRFTLTGFHHQSAADALALALRETRSLALRSNEEKVFLVDMAEKKFGSDPGRLDEEIHASLKIKLNIADSEVHDENVGGIRFFPDGTSTGGLITLISDRERLYVLVDWLTGRVSVLDQESERLPEWVHAS